MKVVKDDDRAIRLVRQDVSRMDSYDVIDVTEQLTQADALRLGRALLGAAGVKMPEWIKASDRLPVHEQLCLVVIRHPEGLADYVELAVWDEQKKCWEDSRFRDELDEMTAVSRWLPLSSLPDWRTSCKSR